MYFRYPLTLEAKVYVRKNRKLVSKIGIVKKIDKKECRRLLFCILLIVIFFKMCLSSDICLYPLLDLAGRICHRLIPITA